MSVRSFTGRKVLSHHLSYALGISDLIRLIELVVKETVTMGLFFNSLIILYMHGVGNLIPELLLVVMLLQSLSCSCSIPVFRDHEVQYIFLVLL